MTLSSKKKIRYFSSTSIEKRKCDFGTCLEFVVIIFSGGFQMSNKMHLRAFLGFDVRDYQIMFLIRN